MHASCMLFPNLYPSCIFFITKLPLFIHFHTCIIHARFCTCVLHVYCSPCYTKYFCHVLCTSLLFLICYIHQVCFFMYSIFAHFSHFHSSCFLPRAYFMYFCTYRLHVFLSLIHFMNTIMPVSGIDPGHLDCKHLVFAT